MLFPSWITHCQIELEILFPSMWTLSKDSKIVSTCYWAAFEVGGVYRSSKDCELESRVFDLDSKLFDVFLSNVFSIMWLSNWLKTHDSLNETIPVALNTIRILHDVRDSIHACSHNNKKPFLFIPVVPNHSWSSSSFEYAPAYGEKTAISRGCVKWVECSGRQRIIIHLLIANSITCQVIYELWPSNINKHYDKGFSGQLYSSQLIQIHSSIITESVQLFGEIAVV